MLAGSSEIAGACASADIKLKNGLSVKVKKMRCDGALKPGQLEISSAPSDRDLSPLIGGGPGRDVPDEDLQFHLAGLRGPRRLRCRHPRG